MTFVELISYAVAAASLAFGAACYLLARRWATDCRACRIIIARKGRVVLDASLVEWLAWNRALPGRERSRGGVIFADRGIQVALARPKIGAQAASQKTRKVEDRQADAVEVATG